MCHGGRAVLLTGQRRAGVARGARRPERPFAGRDGDRRVPRGDRWVGPGLPLHAGEIRTVSVGSCW